MLDEKVKLQQENSSIGIVLFKKKNNPVVEFAIKSFDITVGLAAYKTSKNQRTKREKLKIMIEN